MKQSRIRRTNDRTRGRVFGAGALALVVGLTMACATAGAREVPDRTDTVILLHGMWRDASAMRGIETELARRGYNTVNVSYPSTDYPIEELAVRYLHPAYEAASKGEGRVHIVTHSMGGILARYYLDTYPASNLGRVVMLAPPNQGVEMADRYGHWSLFRWVTGPAGLQLGTGPGSLPRTLGPVDYEVGVIAGSKGRNLLSLMIPGQDDGLVSVASARVEGMRDFLLLEQNHYYIKHDDHAIAQTIHFLESGRFAHADSVKSKAVARAD
jgi:pimeloyl-ACP methyl ester carboxylesterase